MVAIPKINNPSQKAHFFKFQNPNESIRNKNPTIIGSTE
jgi:hypothetical protein